MSLISDALKKARAEAARQDSLRQGMPYAIGVADAPVRRAPWISLLAGLGAGCILAAGVFALAFFAGWGPFRKPAMETPAAAVAEASIAPPPAPASQAPAPSALPAAPAGERLAATPPLQPPAASPLQTSIEAPRQPLPPPADAAPPIARNPAPETAPPAPTPTPAPAPVVQAPAPVPAAPTQPAPAAPEAASGGLVEGNTYSGEVPVPGGGSVKLNGIVFSPDHPIAVLDGRVMGPGENVQGFTVVAIEAGRVKLQGHGATVYLSPK
ncbi:MAG TPA: hypothetical protein VIE43_05200 [Thermoanaerobaculia bacterium]|jgi:hypothetical protein|nr:hypothetical protein [Thermoanaerobaculia bacterium]